MASIVFQIPLKPISLNTSHRVVRFGKRLARVKTNETRKFEELFTGYLNDYGGLKASLLDTYNPQMNSFSVEVFFYLNEKEYFTKAKKGLKTISKRSMDLDNMIKVGMDQTFQWLGVDDSQVTKILAEKIPTNEEPTMVFRISLVRFPELFVVQPESV
jgi:hypothetical protein